MPLDKLTLHAELVLLAKNAESLDKAIRDKEDAIRVALTDLEQTRGARHYHDMVVQQIQQSLAEAEKAAPN
jgi:hypothetical protein